MLNTMVWASSPAEAPDAAMPLWPVVRIVSDVLDSSGIGLLNELATRYWIRDYDTLVDFLTWIERHLGELLAQRQLYEERMRWVLLRCWETQLWHTDMTVYENGLRDADALIISLVDWWDWWGTLLRFPCPCPCPYVSWLHRGEDKLKYVWRYLPDVIKNLNAVRLPNVVRYSSPIEHDGIPCDRPHSALLADVEAASAEEMQRMLELLAQYGIADLDDLKWYIENATKAALTMQDETIELQRSHEERVRRDLAIYTRAFELILQALQDGRLRDYEMLATFASAVIDFANWNIHEMPQIPDLEVTPWLLGRIDALFPRLGIWTKLKSLRWTWRDKLRITRQ